MRKCRAFDLLTGSSRSARALRAAIAVAAPSLLGGARALADPSLITYVAVNNTTPTMQFYVQWDTTTDYNLNHVLWGAEASTYDTDAVSLTAITFSQGDTFADGPWTDYPQTYEFFIGAQGNHSAWAGV